MAIDERDRHRLHQRLDDVLGVAEAATLMSHLPPVGWLDVTTNQQLSAFEARMDARFEAVDARFEAVDSRFEAVDSRFEALQGRMDARFETADAKLDVLRHDFGERLALGLRDQLRVLVFTFIACMLTFASVVIAAVKL
ncbi:MAG: hypothetical protein M3Z46_07290 [Actinomycetota bacterium]|nr:hypothetical protein [Actinomycetota bacterium]